MVERIQRVTAEITIDTNKQTIHRVFEADGPMDLLEQLQDALGSYDDD